MPARANARSWVFRNNDGAALGAAVPANARLNEDGTPRLNEDGSYRLIED